MDTLITNIGQLITPVPARSAPTATPFLDVREHTELLIRDGRIVAVGRTDRREHVDLQIDARGGVLIPGLVDPHTHYASATTSDVANEITGASALASGGGARRRLHDRLRRALLGGVTTVEVKCQSLAELGELSALARTSGDQLPEIVATLFGAAPPPGTAHAERMAGLIGDAIPTVRRRRLARFCDVECGGDAYALEEARTILRAARAAGLHLKLHPGGGGIGALGAVAAELGITAIGHLCELNGRDAATLRNIGVIPVVLPGEGLIGGRPYPDVRRMLDAGLSIGLGTNAGSASLATGSMWLVVALAVTVLGMSLEQAIAAVTLHNAQALESSAEIGTVERGKRADLLILDAVDYRDLLGGLGEDPVLSVIRNGEVVHQR
jgi:imidazolonepropionase